VPPPRRALAPGFAGRANSDCLIEWASTAPTIPKDRPSPRSRFVCRDGDPLCDTDAVSGQCTIELQPCAPGDDARVACVAAPATTAMVGRLMPDNAAIATGLQSSLLGPDRRRRPPGTCGPAVPVVLTLNDKRASALPCRPPPHDDALRRRRRSPHLPSRQVIAGALRLRDLW
jgi:hypothetical protein